MIQKLHQQVVGHPKQFLKFWQFFFIELWPKTRIYKSFFLSSLNSGELSNELIGEVILAIQLDTLSNRENFYTYSVLNSGKLLNEMVHKTIFAIQVNILANT